MANIKKYIFKARYFILAIVCLFPLFYELNGTKIREVLSSSSKISHLLFLFCLALSGFIFWYIFIYDKKGGINYNDIAALIIILGIVIRICYVTGTGYLVRQHDVGGKNGHLEYIYYLYTENRLPDFDVSQRWQFYHPPLWHTVCAVWMRITEVFEFNADSVYETLQCLSLFCSCAVMLVSHKLLRLFKADGAALLISVSIITFHPTFIILSGSINNDVSSLLFALASIVWAIKWYRDPKFKSIIPLAFFIGASMCFKLSGGLVAIAVALLFAARLFEKEYTKKGKLLCQFGVFGIICVPFALWWEIRNLILWNISPTYVPGLSVKSDQYIGFRSVFERIFDISSLWENGIYPARATERLKDLYGFEYYEYNIPLGALKSSVFGEYYIGADTLTGRIFAHILFFAAAIIALFSVFAAVYCVVRTVKMYKKRQFDGENGYFEMISLLVYSVVMIFSYVSFCFGYPHFCTMDFRYIALLAVMGSIYIAVFLKNITNNNNIFGKAAVIASSVTVFLFALGSVFLYTIII